MLATGSQTIGPYWHLILHPEWADLTRFGAGGERIGLTIGLRDGDGAPVGDAAVELWQATPPADARFPGFGRASADAEGRCRFTTIKPGPLPAAGNAWQAPHCALAIFARGLLKPLFTRVYFADEALNAEDPLLGAIADPARRASLIARAAGPADWAIDIVLQGANETVFLEL